MDIQTNGTHGRPTPAFDTKDKPSTSELTAKRSQQTVSIGSTPGVDVSIINLANKGRPSRSKDWSKASVAQHAFKKFTAISSKSYSGSHHSINKAFVTKEQRPAPPHRKGREGNPHRITRPNRKTDIKKLVPNALEVPVSGLDGQPQPEERRQSFVSILIEAIDEVNGSKGNFQ